jgi:hypothetical protein
MISAYVLAGELANAGGRHEEAFGRYEEVLRAFIDEKQRGAERFAAVFAPKTHWGLCFRNQVIKAFAIPGLARLVVGGDIVDTLQLPDYPCQRARHGESGVAKAAIISAVPPMMVKTEANPLGLPKSVFVS